MGQVLELCERRKPKDDSVIFAYDLKSLSKHFLVGTTVINDTDDLVRYDDYHVLKLKKGLSIMSIGIYRVHNRIVGYETTYKDAKNAKVFIKRIAPAYNYFTRKSCHTLHLEYNEHIADIDVMYNDEEITYLELMTSKGKCLKVGTQNENAYTSLNKVDVTQKSYSPIIAFETTFSKDTLKELFIYRCPVRMTRKKRKKNYTVHELNHIRAIPNFESHLKAQQNMKVLKDYTKKGITQMQVVKTWKNLVSNTKSTTITTADAQAAFANIANEMKEREKELEAQEFGADDEGEENPEPTEESKDKRRDSIISPSARKNIRNRRLSTPHPFAFISKKFKDIDSTSASPESKPKKRFSIFGRKNSKKQVQPEPPTAAEQNPFSFAVQKAQNDYGLEDIEEKDSPGQSPESGRRKQKEEKMKRSVSMKPRKKSWKGEPGIRAKIKALLMGESSSPPQIKPPSMTNPTEFDLVTEGAEMKDQEKEQNQDQEESQSQSDSQSQSQSQSQPSEEEEEDQSNVTGN